MTWYGWRGPILVCDLVCVYGILVRDIVCVYVCHVCVCVYMYVTWYVWHGPILFVCMYASNGKLYMCHMCMVYVHVHTRTPARRAPGYVTLVYQGSSGVQALQALATAGC